MYFFNLSFFSLFLFFYFLFFLFSSNFWLGMFFLNFDNFFFFLTLMSFLLFLMIFFSEKQLILVFFSFILIVLCFMFFYCPNLFFLYIFFEFSIFPIVIMILGYGTQIEKINSCYYLFFYSAFCSLPFLVVYFNLDLHDKFLHFNFFISWEFSFFILILFLMKFPLYFLHLWLPKAHVEAPTSASMLLAGLLLKLGTGGFLRVLYLLKFNFEYILVFVSSLGFLLSCFFCLFQSDLKSLAAFSSVNHMMFLLYLLVFVNVYNKFSSVSIMVLHGFISTLMFYFIGEFYSSSGSRMIYFFGGYFKLNLFFLILFSLTWLFNGGIPPSLSFFSEFVGIMALLNISFFSFFIIFFYFFLSFYYTLYILVTSFLSKSLLKISFWNSFSVLMLLFWSLNIFCLNLFF